MASCLGKTFQYINNIIFVYYVDGDFGITSESLIYNDYKSDSAMENYNDKINDNVQKDKTIFTEFDLKWYLDIAKP